MFSSKSFIVSGFTFRSLRDTDVENKHMDTKGARGGWDVLGDWK